MPSLYFEEFSKGNVYQSRGRTITEADVVMFAGLTGDFVPLHTNELVARNGPFGRRVAHGALIFSISIGLTTQMELLHDTVLSFLSVDQLNFRAPVFPGDTIHVTKTVSSAATPLENGGVVKFSTKVENQDGRTVLTFSDSYWIRARG